MSREFTCNRQAVKTERDGPGGQCGMCAACGTHHQIVDLRFKVFVQRPCQHPNAQVHKDPRFCSKEPFLKGFKSAKSKY